MACSPRQGGTLVLASVLVGVALVPPVRCQDGYRDIPWRQSETPKGRVVESTPTRGGLRLMPPVLSDEERAERERKRKRQEALLKEFGAAIAKAEDPAEIGRLEQLRDLSIYRNRLTELPPEIAGLKSLGVLYLNGNPIGDAELEHLKPLKNMQNLGLNYTKATKKAVATPKKALPRCFISSRGSYETLQDGQ